MPRKFYMLKGFILILKNVKAALMISENKQGIKSTLKLCTVIVLEGFPSYAS